MHTHPAPYRTKTAPFRCALHCTALHCARFHCTPSPPTATPLPTLPDPDRLPNPRVLCFTRCPLLHESAPAKSKAEAPIPANQEDTLAAIEAIQYCRTHLEVLLLGNGSRARSQIQQLIGVRASAHLCSRIAGCAWRSALSASFSGVHARIRPHAGHAARAGESPWTYGWSGYIRKMPNSRAACSGRRKCVRRREEEWSVSRFLIDRSGGRESGWIGKWVGGRVIGWEKVGWRTGVEVACRQAGG